MSMVLIQAPATYNFSGNIPDLIVTNTEQTSFSLSCDGQTIVSETYHPDKEARVVVNLRNILEQVVTCPDIRQSPLAIPYYTYRIGPSTGSFYCIRGGHSSALLDETFIRDNFLTWQPQTRHTLYHVPHYLRYAALSVCLCKVKGYFADGTVEIINLVTEMLAGTIYTIDATFATIRSRFNTQPTYYDIWIEDTSGNVMTWTQRYILKDYLAGENDFFVFENSLGGFDTVHFPGERTEVNKLNGVHALFDDQTLEYDVDRNRSWKKYTGYLSDENTRLWVLDFFNSNNRYYLCDDGRLKRIVVSEHKLESTSGEAAGYEFSYSYSKQSKYISLSRIDVPDLLEIVDPYGELFFLAPRLNQFEYVDLSSDDILIPVQRMHSKKWFVLPAALIKTVLDGHGNVLENLTKLFHPKEGRVGLDMKAKDLLAVGNTSTKTLDVEEVTTSKKVFVAEEMSSQKYVSGMFGEGGTFRYDSVSKQWIIEIDSIYVRGSLHVPELVLDKMRAVNGSLIVSCGGGKIASVLDQDLFYVLTIEDDVNPFVVGDFINCKVFTGSQQKTYWVPVLSVAEKSVAVAKEEFGGALPEAGDEIIQLGNDRDSARQSAILISASDLGAPYIDTLTGIKTRSLAGCVRARTGNLTGISTHLWGTLDGVGLYSENAYLTGDFRLRTGEDVWTKFEVLEGLFQSAMKSVVGTMTAADNYLKNAIFGEDMAFWERESDINLYQVNGQLLDLGGNFYSEKNKVADVDSFDGRLMLRIKHSFIRQLNADMTKPASGSVLYLTLKYHCRESGILTAGFAESGLYTKRSVPAEEGFQVLELSGEWDGIGDFLIRFSGDVYIEQLTLTTHPLDDYKKEVSTLFEQTEEHILAMAKEVDQIDQTIKTAGWITSADGNKLWANKKLEDGSELVSLINQTAEGITIQASKIALEGVVTANSNFQILLDGSIVAKNGKFEGEITATSGSIGGFSIAYGRIGSKASATGPGGDLSIQSDLFRVGGLTGFAMFGNNVFEYATDLTPFSTTGRIVNTKSHPNTVDGLYTANYGIFIHVSGATNNYGIDSNAALRAPAFINTEVGVLNLVESSYDIDFSQRSIFSVYAPVWTEVTLPSEARVASKFGLKELRINFGYVFTLVARGGSAKFVVNNVYNHDHNLENIDMEGGDVLTILCTKYPTFHYKVLSKYNR